MIKKKSLIYLFLFAFVFSLTVSVSTNAGNSACCPLDQLPGCQEGGMGAWIVDEDHPKGGYCVYTGLLECEEQPMCW